MPARLSIRDAASGLRLSRHGFQTALLAGVSALTIGLVLGNPAQAGDLLKGNRYASPTMSASAATAALASLKQAQAATQQARNSLAAATRAIQAMQQNQAAWRNLSLAGTSTVPNGLGAGGLQVAPGVGTDPTLWQGAKGPVQTSTNGQTTVTIDQTAQKSILTWQNYNVGRDTTVYYNQSAGNQSNGTNNWVSLNRIVDPSTSASTILGSIKAEGSVYLINRNGIIFGGSSQVNVHSLIASSLDLFSSNTATSNNRFLNGGIGDLNATNFATNSILLTSSTPGAGNITIAPGASITTGNQGLALVAAPNVTNNGVITAPGGQVALVAGIGVSYDYVTPTTAAEGTNGNATTNLRFANYGKLTDGSGHDVTPVGTLLNTGEIYTPRGNITLLGGAIQQDGVTIATTNVAQPGSIIVTSAYEVGVNPGSRSPDDQSGQDFYTGSITFGPQGVTSILPDGDSATLPSDAVSLAPFQALPGVATFGSTLPIQGPGLIAINGQAVDFQGGSEVYAPGQTVSAGTKVLADPRTSVPGSGRILLEDGAIIDVSGIPDTELSVSDNLLTVKLGGNELADDPLQQGGFLFGSSITVDMGDMGVDPETGESWVGSPLANLASYANLVQRSIGQLLVNGGAIYLTANEVVGAPGSIINLTGGYVHYLGGNITTTRLADSSGHIYDIGQADPNDIFIGIAGQFTVHHDHWSITETYNNLLMSGSHYQSDYIQGGNAGTLNIVMTNGGADSGAVVLQSTLVAQSIAGLRQIDGGVLPNNGTFNFTGIDPIEIASGDGASPLGMQLPAGFNAAAPLLGAAGSDYAVNVFDSQVLNAADFHNISLATGQTGQPFQAITEDAGASLNVQAGGSISFSGDTVAVNGTLMARGGAITITTTPGGATNAVPGDILIGASGVLDVSGYFVNESQLPLDQPVPPLPIDAGSISLVAGVSTDQSGSGAFPNSNAVDLSGNITLAAGSLLDLRGGGHVGRDGLLETDRNGVPLGTGGNLSLQTDGWTLPINSSAPLPTRGRLTLDGTIDALGFNGGGTLTLGQAAFQIGGDAATAPAGAFYFDAGRWGDLGFGSFVLNAMLQAEVPDGAVVALHHRNLLPDLTRIGTVPNGARPEDDAISGFLSGTQRSATNLSVTAGLEQKSNSLQVTSGGSNDAAEVGLGAQILGDPGADISISSYAMTTILGTISAPGGSISLAVATGGGLMTGPLYLGANSVLDVSGTTVADPFPSFVHTAAGIVTPFTGEILAGGTVSLSDTQSTILVAPGAVIDVSGAAGAFDVAHQVMGGDLGAGQIVLDRQPVWSDAGEVDITGGAGLLFEGTLIGKAGAAQAAGGTLSLTAGNMSGNPSNLILVQDAAQAVADAGASFDFSTFVPTLNGVGALAIDTQKVGRGSVLFGADSLNGSGFDNLILTNNGGAVGYTGQVALTLNKSVVINASSIIAANEGNYVWVSSTSGPNLPTVGGVRTTDNASLTVTAPYIVINGSSGVGAALPALVTPNAADATLTLNADQIDLAAFVDLHNIAQATFNSSGDIRLLPAQFLPQGSSLLGYLATAGNLTFNAADLYPATDTAFVLQAVNGSKPTTITFGYPDGVAPSTDTPLSAGGTLLVSAMNILQDGEIQAPFGSIILGTSNAANAIRDALGGFNSNIYLAAVSTQSVTLGSGSITSVSAHGMVIPFGNTIDQTTWMYNPQLNNPGWSSNAVQPSFANPLTSAPQGVITLNGSTVAFQPGATVDISGGGDLQAQEWIPGTGGSRDVLSQVNISYANSKTGTQVPLYPDGRQVFAIVPGYDGKLAPYDAATSQSNMIAGQRVYLSGGPGLPAGYYTLLPAKYATLPGAYRVVVNAGVTNPVTNQTFTLPDGTMEMTGYLGNSFNGARDTSISQFMIQPAAIWSRYSQYISTSAESFFPGYASLNNLAIPHVPNDAGRLVLSAKTGLTLGGTLLGDAAPGGAGSQVDISSQFIEVTGHDGTVDPGYLGIDAAALDSLGADSLLIGGTRAMTADGTVVTPTANGVIVANDASDPLTAPQILLVAAPQFQNTTIAIDSEGDTTTILTPVADTGLVTIRGGSVIRATGDATVVPATRLILGSTLSALQALPDSVEASNALNNGNILGTAAIIANYYKALDAALGTVIDVSAGGTDTVQLPSQALIRPGQITVKDNINLANPDFIVTLPSLDGAASGTAAMIEAGAEIDGSNALTMLSTGDVRMQSGAVLSAANINVTSSDITFVGSDAVGTPPGGLVIDAAIMSELAKAQNVNLQSYNGINFDGDVDVRMNGTKGQVLTLGGGLNSDGGAATIAVPTLVLNNTLSAPAVASSGSGSLSIDVDELIFGGGTKALTGFGSLDLVAHQAVIGEGTGSMDFGALPVTLLTPTLIADTASDQTLTTTGALVLTPTGDKAPVSDALGGAITLQGGSVTVAAPIQALAGNITLKASAGDVTVASGGSLIAHGIAKRFVDTVAYASAGSITLTADHGTVDIQSGGVLDFAGAAGGGNGGGLIITTTNSAAPVALGGTLLGTAAAGYTGSIFTLDSSGAVVLDDLAQTLTNAGVTGGIGIHSALGALVLNTTLTAAQVALVADGGSVIVNGTVDASGTAGGTIQLYGTGSVTGGVVTGGVTVNGKLLARASDPSQLGGAVEIGTSGQFNPATGTYNSDYGYENVAALKSGTITIGATAVIDVSGSASGGLSDGTVLLRAPLLDDQNVNVVLAPSATFRGARSVGLESYAIWSTADHTSGAQHFDGIVDPAGWYDPSGKLLPGTFTDAGGNVLATYDGSNLTAAQLATFLTNDYFTPATANTDPTRSAHETFYGYADGDDTIGMPGTLMGFIETPSFKPVAGSTGIANFQRVVGVELDNPVSAGINNGDIKVVSNWNLGALDSSGMPLFRTNGIAPDITFRAGGNIAINASISDGFAQNGATFIAPGGPPSSSINYLTAQNDYTIESQNWGIVGFDFGGLTFDPATMGPLAPMELGTPTASDKYYSAYEAYLVEFANYWEDAVTFNVSIFQTFFSSSGDLIDSVTASALTSASTAYSSSDLSQYGNYLALYDVYVQDYKTYSGSVLTVGTLPVAPLPPPTISTPVASQTGKINAPNLVATSSNAAPIAAMNLASEASSTSYRIVAGANMQSANPLALDAAGSGDVTLDGHSDLGLVANTDAVIAIPTIVRTGTGSIDIAAAGDFELLDHAAPGVVYTAGTIPDAPANDTSSLGLGDGAYRSAFTPTTGVSTILTSVVNPDDAGNITLTVRGDIIGFQNVVDNLAEAQGFGSGAPTGLSGNPGAFLGQFWTPWLLANPSDPDVAWYVNFGSFDQGIMSVGGNVTVRSGGDIRDLAVSLPTTAYLDGSDALHITGGGNLSVTAGGSIYSGDFYVGQGVGIIKAGGAISSDLNFGRSSPVPTLLAVQYGTIDVDARQSVEIGGVYDPTYLWSPDMGDKSPVASRASAGATEINYVPYVTSMDADSGVSIQSTGGSVIFNSLLSQGSMFSLGQGTTASVTSLLLPASLSLIAIDGGLAVEHGGGLYPSTTGTLTLLADQSIDLAIPMQLGQDNSGNVSSFIPTFSATGNVSGTELGKLDDPVGTGILPTASNPELVDASLLTQAQSHDPAMVLYDGDPVRIYALNGNISDGAPVIAGTSDSSGFLTAGMTGGQISLIPNAPAQLYAGIDILDLPFYGENFSTNDITSIIAGRDITYNVEGNRRPTAIELAGPGTLDVEAGRNINFQTQRVAGAFEPETGIRTIGNSIDDVANPDGVVRQRTDTSTFPFDYGNPYLPQGGASVSVLFGVAPGMDTASFITQYINPANAAALMPSSQSTLIAFVDQYMAVAGGAADAPQTADQAWAIFHALPAAQQKLLVEQVFTEVLDATGEDYNDPASPFFHQYARGFDAINALFPASLGYTANDTGASNGTNQTVMTGNFDMRGATVQTQQGGNVSILGPGGRILVGSSVASPAVDPASEGILTLEKGNIATFTDTDVLVAQSRVMTEQGGDILMWSSNGNLDAGKGAKTSVSAPPPLFACDIDFICSADIKGAVSGAGIATLQSLTDVPVGNANLVAPRGTVDFGAAGVRTSGNLNVAALVVANSFNIQVQGVATGIPVAATPNLGALTTASNASGAAAAAASDTDSRSRNRSAIEDLPSIITVQVIGYGGGENEDGTSSPAPQKEDDKRKKKPQQQSYNYDPNGMFRVLGNGRFTEDQTKDLTDDERKGL